MLCRFLRSEKRTTVKIFRRVCAIFEPQKISFKASILSLLRNMAGCNILDSCDFKSTPEEMRAKAEEIFSECRQACDAIANVPDEDVSFETVLKALDDVHRKLLNGQFAVKAIPHLAVDPETRKASSEVHTKYQNFVDEMRSRPDLFHKIQVLEGKKLPLTGESKYFLEKLLEAGKKSGFHLPSDVQEKIRNLKSLINEKCSTFTNNIAECKTTLEFTEEELKGLPQDLIDELEKSADSGKRKVTMKYPHYCPVMEMCQNPSTRKAMKIANDSRCLKENTALLDEICGLRHERAVLLGYPSHASLIATQMQAKNSETVQKFLNDLYQKLTKIWDEEKKCLLEIKEEECKDLNLPFDGKLNAWDTVYYCKKIEKLKFNIDNVKFKEYFPLDVVTKGMFHIYQKMLGLVFTEVENPKVWHPDVKLYRVTDANDGQLMGYFFLDLFPRDGKYTHAAIEGIQTNCIGEDGTRQPNIVEIMCNFQPSTVDKPSLLMHNEVEVYFHEFGHVMANMCAQNAYIHFNPHDIQSDFLEVPSMMLENWIWEKEPLKLMSAHYVTGESLPDDMICDLQKSKLANFAHFYIRQIVFAMFDQEIHSKGKVDTASIYSKVSFDLIGIEAPSGTNFAASFGHMCHEYDARYFGYLWSEVASTDMFETRFKGNNLMDPELGKRYRDEILGPAGSKDPRDILRSFLGRDVSQDAFLRSKGLKV